MASFPQGPYFFISDLLDIKDKKKKSHLLYPCQRKAESEDIDWSSTL